MTIFTEFLGYNCLQSHCIHTQALVQWSTHLLPVMRDPGSIPRGVLTVCETGIFLLALSYYIGEPNVIVVPISHQAIVQTL
jgi:hypothetical protein